MSEISLPYALGLTVLGMAIVFIVLVFLMIIIFVMTALIRRYSVKPAVTAESAVAADALSAPDGIAQDTMISETTAAQGVSEAATLESPTTESAVPEPAMAIAESAADVESSAAVQGDPSAALTPTKTAPTPKKYRVIINGVEFEVDAEYGLGAPVSTSPQPEAPAAPDGAAPGTSVLIPTGATFAMASDTKKYRVVVNDIEYEVDAVTDAAPEPVLTTSGTRKYKVIVNDIEYEVDAETGETAVASGIEKG